MNISPVIHVYMSKFDAMKLIENSNGACVRLVLTIGVIFVAVGGPNNIYVFCSTQSIPYIAYTRF